MVCVCFLVGNVCCSFCRRILICCVCIVGNGLVENCWLCNCCVWLNMVCVCVLLICVVVWLVV